MDNSTRGTRTPAPRTARSAVPIDEAVERLWQRPGFLLRRCLQQTSGVFEQSCAEIGLTTRQYDYLFMLAMVGQISQGELGRILGMDPATNTLVIKILERKQWIERTTVADDTRKRTVRITDDGRAVFLAAKKAAEASIKSIHEALDDAEYDQLLLLLRKVVQAGTPAAEAASD